MLKKIYTAIIVVITAANFAMAQSGALKGKAIDETNGEGISFANVQLEQNGNAVAKAVADINGDFTIKPIPPGVYDVKVASVGYQTYFSKGVIIGGDKTTYVDAKVKSTMIEQATFVVVEYVEPLVKSESGGTVTREEFQAMPSKNINSVAATTAGVFQKDEGGELNVRGGRADGTDYYIDGEKVSGSSGAGLPQSSIEQVSVITGGVPAQYGDATGGFINITTRGGMRNDYFGGIELISSQFTDAYDHNFFGGNVGGPLVTKKDSSGNKQAKIGFFISGEVSTDKDPSPSAVGINKVNDEKLAFLEKNPLALSETAGGTLLNAELLRTSDLEHVKARQNVRQNSARLNGKIDFKASNNITFTLGGNVDYNRHHFFIYEYALLNPANNPEVISNTKRVYGKVTHKLGKGQSKDNKSTSIIQNAYYTLQVGYTKYNAITQQDDNHKDKYFDYGYIGKFETKRAPTYNLFSKDLDATLDSLYYEQVVVSDTQVVFTPGTQNPLGTNYTTQFYDLVAGDPDRLSDITAGYGIINGDRPRSVYSIWYNTGRQYGGYAKADQSQMRVTGQFSGDIKNHAIQAGFEWEKRDDRSWFITPIDLWTKMRLLTNKHITQLDTTLVQVSGPIYLVDGTVVTNPQYDVFAHPFIVNADEQSQFDRSIRAALGKGPDEWIDIDSYDPSTFNLSMFSPDELGSTRVGYTYDGERLKGKTTYGLAELERYHTEKDANGNYTRVLPSAKPVYISGFIQDKFDIKDMKFNIGVRVDRYNANLPVQKDKYLGHYEAYTVSEASNFSHPSSMSSDAVVYVDDAKNPTQVLGYRNEDTWYNDLGVQISDPKLITPSTGLIQPYLKYPGESKSRAFDSSAVENTYKMYEVQTTFMPRIAFTFPISDRASFFAHYDVLSQRPPNVAYNSFVNGHTSVKPERTTDYELGFSQVLNERKNAALSLSAFYREMRDMIQVINVYGAYPAQFITYGNIDFGTVKGFTVSYDLRRTNNVSMNASYTLQFADGTGSASASAGGIIGSGQPNLRTTMPLDFDQRHAIVLSTDYRFGKAQDYKGPKAKWAKMLFENFGGNMVFRVGSGSPYTRQKNVTSGNGNNSSAVVFGINQRSSIKGKLNGSNLPWTYRADLRLDKNITLIWKKAEGETKEKSSNLNIYLQVLNVLNTKNIINLYRFTGDADDDGFLTAPENQNVIADYDYPDSFRDMYASKIANPSHYSIPRRTRIGVVLDF